MQNWQILCSRHSGMKSGARLAQAGRAFAFCQTDFQRRVRNWQILHSQHSGMKSDARLAQAERAFTFCQTDFQRRVRDWQIPHSRHSGMPDVYKRQTALPPSAALYKSFENVLFLLIGLFC